MPIIGTLPFLLQNGTTADATQVDADFDKIVNDVNANAAGNGINSDITALTALTTPLTPAQGGTSIYIAATSTGTANAQVVASPSPTGFTLAIGKRVTFIASFTNTGAMTLDVNATGATAVQAYSQSGLVPLVGGEVVVGTYVEVIFNGTVFELVTNANAPIAGTAAVVTSAATTDLGASGSHFVTVTGTNTITSFGSSASLAFPLYIVEFLGALTLTYNGASLILPGGASITTAAGDTALVRYFGSGNWIVLAYNKLSGQPVSFGANFLQNYLTGLTLSTAGGSGTFGIAAGEAADSTNTVVMLLNSAYTKSTASWSVGSGSGGLDTGAIANTTWYHVYLIERPDTGVVDVIFSLSASAPTLPANYTKYRRIGSMKTDGSAHWILFTQTGDTFIWSVSLVDVNNIATTAARANKVLTVPTGIVVSALFRATLDASGTSAILFTSLQESDQTPVATTGLADLSVLGAIVTAGAFERFTDTSAQIGVRSTTTGDTYSIFTYGWRDLRGRLG